MYFFQKLKQAKKNLIFKIIIRNNSYFKIYVKRLNIIIAKIYYNNAPKSIKKIIHQFVSSELSKKYSNNNLFSSVYFDFVLK